MRIGFHLGEIYDEAIGGGYTFQNSIVNALANITSEHEFIFYFRGRKKNIIEINNAKFVNLNNEKVSFFKKKKKLQKVFNKRALEDKLDLVYFITPSYEYVDLPYIFTVWDLNHRRNTFFPEVSINREFEHREAFYKNAITPASSVVIGNQTGKRQICKYYNMDEDRVKTIPMPTPSYVYSGEEDDKILIKLNLKKDRYLFYPAQFWAHKNHIRLLKAMKILKEQGFDYKMVFTGSDKGNKYYIEQKIKEFNLEKEVVMAGFVTKEELISLYKNAYALTYVSAMGPDNIPPLEAMALKCPVISSNAEGMQEQLDDCALYFDLKDENELVEQIKKLSDENLRQELINKGEVLAKNCSTQNYAAKMLEIIDEFKTIRECWG